MMSIFLCCNGFFFLHSSSGYEYDYDRQLSVANDNNRSFCGSGINQMLDNFRRLR